MTKLCVCECVLSYCMLNLCVCEVIVCEIWDAAGGGGGEGARDTESKTRTPHKVVGKKTEHRHSKYHGDSLKVPFVLISYRQSLG